MADNGLKSFAHSQPLPGIVIPPTAVKAAMSMLIPFILSQAVVGGYGQTSPASAELDGYYNPHREVTFSGTVTGKTKGKVPGMAQGMSILIRSGKNLREVELGPAWYVGRQSASVNMGDKVKVTGVPLRVGRENVILARQVTRGRNILALRDTDGMPYWNPVRRTRVAVNGGNSAAQRMDNRFEGTIGSTTTYNVGGENYSGYVLNTATGPVDVAVAPTWYWNNQPTYYRVGDTITLFGTRGNATNVNGVILVNSMDYAGGTIILRPGGIPVFNGFRRMN